LCPAVDVLELVDISLQNDKFDEIEPYQVMPLLELCVTTVNSNKEVDEDTLKKIQENFGGVGRQLQIGWYENLAVTSLLKTNHKLHQQFLPMGVTTLLGVHRVISNLSLI